MNRILTLLLVVLPTFLVGQIDKLDSWKMNEEPIFTEWELVDTMDLDTYSQYEVWDEETTFVKEVPASNQASPNDQVYYQARLNRKTGEYYARVVRYTWRRFELVPYRRTGNVKIRSLNK